MTALVSTLAALLVSTSVIFLQPVQKENQRQAQEALLSNIVGTLPGLESLMKESGVDSLSTRWVQLDTGMTSATPPHADYDPELATNDPDLSIEIPKQDDVAGISRRALILPVHLLGKRSELELVVLPVYASGYQSTIRAWLALSGDAQTVVSLSIIDQAETPGLGSRILEPDWLAQWADRSLYDESGELVLRVSVGPAVADAEIDGISGATRTGNGINNMLQYWLGANGFGPFLQNIEQGNISL